MKSMVIAATSLRRMFRDRTALFFTMVFPVVLIFFVGSATSRFDDGQFPLGVVDRGSGALGAELQRALERHPTVMLERYDDREELAQAVRRGVVSAGIVLPARYDERLRAGERAEVEFVIDQTRGFPAAVRSVVSEAVARQGALVQAAAFVTDNVGHSFDENLSDARRSSDLLASVAVGVQTAAVGRADEEADLPPGFNYQVPSQLILFVFITSLAGAAALIQSRRLNVTRRMLGTPSSARTILLGETLGRFATAGFQAVFIFLVGTLVFGVEWGSPLGATAVIVLFVLVATSVAMLFGAMLPTPELASAVGVPVGIGSAMLGGCMWPLEIVPPTMRTVGHAFPHAWAMDAWIELIGRGGGIGDITLELGVLAGFVAVLMPLATWRLRRSIVTD